MTQTILQVILQCIQFDINNMTSARNYHGRVKSTQCLESNGSTKVCVTTLPTSHPAIWLFVLLLFGTTSHRVLYKAPGKRTRIV